jgi:YD repeat-containing protein
MITGITRNAQAVRFAYDRTYQLTSERGSYTNAAAGQIATITNRFAYDRAGNRVSHSTIDHGTSTIVSKSYRHTSDNQLTGIYWNSSKVTLGGDIEQAWTTLWVRVQQSGTNQPTTASIKCQRGQAVAWEVRDLDIIGSGSIMFTVTVAAVKSTNTAAAGSILIWTNSTTVTYTNTSSGAGSITYAYDANGNRTGRVDKSQASVIRATRYQYDVDNQLTGITEWSNSVQQFDYTYEYDVLGRRIRATEDTTNRHFVYDGLDCIAELDSTGGVTKTYVRGGGLSEIIAEVNNHGTTYFSYNHRGDLVTATRPDGQATNTLEFSACGLPLSVPRYPGSGERPVIARSGKEYDERTRLTHRSDSYYDSEAGRATYVTSDTLRQSTRTSPEALLSTTLERNVYQYATASVPVPVVTWSERPEVNAIAGELNGHLKTRCPHLSEDICVEPPGGQVCSSTGCSTEADKITKAIADAITSVRNVGPNYRFLAGPRTNLRRFARRSHR